MIPSYLLKVAARVVLEQHDWKFAASVDLNYNLSHKEEE
jgi:hypothetical protein